jgi:hypothetical protein
MGSGCWPAALTLYPVVEDGVCSGVRGECGRDI